MGEDFAWAAGIIDGEGCLGVYLRGDGATVCSLTVVMNSRAVPRQLHRLFGGNVFRGASESWGWRVTNREHIEEVLTAIRPRLLVKDRQADEFIRWNHSNRGPLQTMRTVVKLKQLKRKVR